MALCVPQGCGCAIRSTSITVAGDGSGGNPYTLTALGTAVCTSGTRPTPILGLQIWETDTLRTLIYDGSNWVIVGGMMPGVSCVDTANQSILSASVTTVVLANEVYDTDGFHTGTNGFFTVPAGLGGDYIVAAAARFPATLTGSRYIQVSYTSNTSVTNESTVTLTLDAGSTNSLYANVLSDSVRLEAGAIATFSQFQDSGGALNSTNRLFRLKMLTHIPSLV